MDDELVFEIHSSGNFYLVLHFILKLSSVKRRQFHN